MQEVGTTLLTLERERGGKQLELLKFRNLEGIINTHNAWTQISEEGTLANCCRCLAEEA